MAKNPTSGTGQNEDDFEDTPAGWAARWAVEFRAAKKGVEAWHTEGEKTIRRFLDDRDKESERETTTRVNLFSANVQTMRALLYGKPPSATVSRRFDDFGDDVGRVAGEMMERILNSDIERPADGFRAALFHALDDRLLPGMGVLRLRYVREEEPGQETPAKLDDDTGQELAPAVPAESQLVTEDVESEHVHWRDFLWSPCRVYHLARWGAIRHKLSKRGLIEKFGDAGKLVPLNSKRVEGSHSDVDATKSDPWSRADVWEIWDKENGCVWYYVEGWREVLVPVGVPANPNGSIPDPLGLDGFWPWPEPLFANLTTSKLMPVPDFRLAADLYDDIDKASSRITLLEDAVRAVGVYDKSAGPSLGKLLDSGNAQNKLYPVDNWAMFAEKGGIKGALDMLPLDAIVIALDKLREMRTETMGLLYQVTGMSDIMRGQAAEQTTATEQAIKAKFASVRVQALQDEFARFAGEAQHIKAQIVAKYFSPQTIVQRSNVQSTPDAPLVGQALEFLKSNMWCYRVEVKPESISLTDYAALRQENVEVMSGLASFFQGMIPAVQMLGPAGPEFVMHLGQWFVSRLKGASAVESIFDAAVAKATQAMQQPKPPPPPDPKVVAQQMKNQGDMQRIHAETQGDIARNAAEAKGQLLDHAAKAHFEVQTMEAKERLKAMAQLNAVVPGPAGTP